MLGVLLYHFMYYFFETVSLTKHGARMVVRKPVSAPSNTEVKSACSSALLFMWVLGSELGTSHLYSKCSYYRVIFPAKNAFIFILYV